jgi:hypothetical protein
MQLLKAMNKSREVEARVLGKNKETDLLLGKCVLTCLDIITVKCFVVPQ